VCVNVDMKGLRLVKDDAHIRDRWRSLISDHTLINTLPQSVNEGVILYGLHSPDVNR